jgi:hypothetical protein
MLTATTPQLWPENARQIMKDKGINVEELKIIFTSISFPWDNDYDKGRTYFSLRIQQRPLFIVKCQNDNEVEEILNYVKEKNLTVRIMNGRHSTQLLNPEVIVDMSSFTYLNLDGDILTIGAGNTQGSVNNFLFSQGNLYSHFGCPIHPRVEVDLFPGGSASTVGMNITTVGGVGTLVRTYGLAIDSVIEYKVVLPPSSNLPARVVIANKRENEDLFWALRGGGVTNFGILLSLSVKVVEVGGIIPYTVKLNGKKEKNLSLWMKNSLSRPKQFNEDFLLFTNAEGDVGIELSGIYVMGEKETYNVGKAFIEITLQDFVEKSKGKLIIGEENDYSLYYKNLVRDRTYFNFSIIQTMFTSERKSREIVKSIEKGKNIPAPLAISLTLLGGEVSKVDKRETAFYPRKKHFFVDVSSKWNDVYLSQEVQNWTNDVVKKLLTKGTYEYVGFPITFTNIEYNNTIYYGKNYKKLQSVKKKYDELNIMTYSGTIQS